MRIASAFGVFSIALATVSAGASTPANPKASAKAKSVLDYFQGLPARADHRVVSGQFTDFGEGSNLKIAEDIQAATGHWPGLIGADYADFAHGSVTYRTPDKTLLAYAKAGGLVTLSAHLPHPGGGGLRDRDVDLSQLLVAGSAQNLSWMRTLDSVAAGLTVLRDAGVVVLWRPLHEMNGDWFWWNGKDEASFIALWRQMFDYFTKAKGLDNLLWIYSPNMGAKAAAYYPGDGYVDMTGLDCYTDNIDTNTIKGYGELAALGKPFGFSEYGPHDASNPPGDFDYRRLIEGIRNHFPKACYFMSWNSKWSLTKNLFAKEFLDDAWIANREDLAIGSGIRLPILRARNGRLENLEGLDPVDALGRDYGPIRMEAMRRGFPAGFRPEAR